MLTSPSDSLPQIVCPMDEHAIPSDTLCSAPPHSEPPPALLPLSSITPSPVKNGSPGHRRSSRIQEVRGQTPQKSINKDGAAETPSPTKRQNESVIMGSQSKQPRAEDSAEQENQNEDGFDISPAERQNQQQQQQQQEAADLSAGGNTAEQFAVDAAQTEPVRPDMETCSRLAVGDALEDAALPKGWVIGPLFQSLKMKMATFTEIVMSPVKLFRANSPPLSTDHLEHFELRAGGENSESFLSEAQSETVSLEAEANQQSHRQDDSVALKCSKILWFDEELPTLSSTQPAEPVSVPLLLRQSEDAPLASHASADVRALDEQKCNVTLRRKPPPGKCKASRCGVKKVPSEAPAAEVQQVPLVGLVPSDEGAQPACPPPQDGGRVESLVDANGAALKLCAETLQPNPEPCAAAGCGGAKSRPHGSVKRKRLTDEACAGDRKRQELIKAASEGGVLRASGADASTDAIVKRSLEAEANLHHHHHHRQEDSVALKCSKILWFDEELPTLSSTQSEDAPLASVQSSVASQASADDQRCNMTLRRKCTESRCGVKKVPSKAPAAEVQQVPLVGLVSSNEADAQKRKRAASADPIVDAKEALMPARKRPPVSTRANKKAKGAESASSAQTDASSDAKVSGESENNQKRVKAKQSASCKTLKTSAGVNVGHDSLALETSVAITSTRGGEQEALSELLRHPAIKPLQSSSKRRNISTKPAKRRAHTPESDGTFSTSSAEPPDVLNASRKGQNEPSKRAKKGLKNAASAGSQDVKQGELHFTAKENQPDDGKEELSVDSVYFEMTPFVQPVPSLSQPSLECRVQLDKEVKLASGERVAGLRSSSRRPNAKPRRERVLQGRTRADEVSVTVDDAALSTGSSRSAGSGSSRRLMRSYSCPEIPSLRPHDSPHHGRLHPPRHLHFPLSPPVQLARKALPRARRHTVCSVEVEREIAPLCLRKEVYPARRSLPFDRASQHLALSPSTSLSALASCFLSSPLAFLSKRAESRAASSSASSHASSPSSSPSTFPKIFLQRVDSSSSAVEYSSSNVLECERERRQREEEDDAEDTSSSSQEFEDVSLREEKALSDSEIKVVQKHKERGKVSSIKIRKTLPKPQNNLTPMGLPKLVRLNKKEFSLEEIYTNKNFTKAPESRLETIFEVPLKHRNGSESWFGQRRFKRFLEFLDSSKVRKPKKPLVGAGKSGVSSSRTRRGGFPKDQPQDLDSLLCAKLSQLSLWLTLHQGDC